MRPEADPRVRAEVAEDAARLELRVDGRRTRGRAATTDPPRRAGVARAHDLEPGCVGEVDQELRLAQRALADPLDADLLDEVVAGGPGVVRGHVRRAR